MLSDERDTWVSLKWLAYSLKLISAQDIVPALNRCLHINVVYLGTIDAGVEPGLHLVSVFLSLK